MANSNPRVTLAVIGVALAVALPARADVAETIDRIFLRSEFDADVLRSPRWMADSSAYTVLESSATVSGAQDVVRYDVRTGKREVVVSASDRIPPGLAKPLPIESYEWSRDARWLLFCAHLPKRWHEAPGGEYWLMDTRARTLRKIGLSVGASVIYASLSPDGLRVAYVHDQDLYVEEVASGATTRLTHDGSTAVLNGLPDWLSEEDWGIKQAYLWSPDSRHIAYWQFDTSEVGTFAIIDNTAGLYPVVRRIPWPKAGTTNSAVRVGVVAVTGGETRWMQVPGDPREHYIPRIDWVKNSTELLIEQLNRPQNRKLVFLADIRSGATSEFFRDTDAAWVDVHSTEWLPGGRDWLALSDRSGWRRLYTVSHADRRVQPLTPDSVDVLSFVSSEVSGKWVYYIASPENATQRYLFRARTDGSGPAERVTPRNLPGTHEYIFSPDGKLALHTYSTFDRPPVIDLVRLPGHEVVRVLAANQALRRRVEPLLQSVEFFQVTLEDGIGRDGYMIRPRNFDPTRRYPVIVYVYGGPWTVAVTDDWPARNHRRLFHHALAADGFIILCIDNSGNTAPKGRTWRKAMFGALDGKARQEQPKLLQILLRQRPYLDVARVGTWGWSAGGSNTLHLMFRSPELYHVGAAVASMPDHLYYDTAFTERYIGTPEQNPEAYRDSSAIHYADGLRGRLLLIHGEADDNVQFQGAQLLVNRLVKLGKTFDFFAYPGGTHGLAESKEMQTHVYQSIARHFRRWLAPESTSTSAPCAPAP